MREMTKIIPCEADTTDQAIVLLHAAAEALARAFTNSICSRHEAGRVLDFSRLPSQTLAAVAATNKAGHAALFSAEP